MGDDDLNDRDAEIDAILAREAAIRARRRRAVSIDHDSMHRALEVAFGKVDRQWRRATTPHEVKTFEC